MSRFTIRGWLVFAAVLAAIAGPTFGAAPAHLDPGLNSGSCSSCHAGHGLSGSPMLPASQREVCLACHGSPGDMQNMMRLGNITNNAQPPLLDTVLNKPYQHPVSMTAFLRSEPSEVTCSSCHSPHRGREWIEGTNEPGTQYPSIRDISKFEFELCQTCHGDDGALTLNLTDVSRQFSPENSSYHPVEARSREDSGSVDPNLAGRFINCSDCHGNSDPSGATGLHGSDYQYILRRQYVMTDGAGALDSSFALCFSCHSSDAVLNSNPFPEHGVHINKIGASCATCHSAHGSVSNRALIRFGEETMVSGVSASTSTGILAFKSDSPGSGVCYLTCHGMDHGPMGYGELKFLETGEGFLKFPVSPNSLHPGMISPRVSQSNQ